MSTEAQLKGDSERRQREASTAYAVRHDLELQELETETASAFRGGNAEFGPLRDFLIAAKERKVSRGSVLIIESFDRLSRQNVMKALLPLTDIIGTAGLTLNSPTSTEQSVRIGDDLIGTD